jgi:nitroreductase
MTFLELCQQRYSTRQYSEVSIEQEKLDYILRCAQLAPSAVNFQPWKIRVVTKPAQIKALRECYNRAWFETVTHCLVVYKNTEVEWVRKSDQKPHGDIDVAILTEHICLAATEVGLGTCWVCNFDVEKLLEAFPVPSYLQPVVMIPIGYPADEAKPKQRKQLSEILIS